MGIERISASNGSKHISSADGAQTNVGCFGFIAQEDTVVSVLLGGDGPNDISNDFEVILGITGKTLKAGALIIVPIGKVMNSITVASGSIIVYYSW